ncbi:SGNH/GDSL hydrolase family protein [Lacisediminihabitans profunda]|uniref:SGNH/GDSL hydrolase family protein n=1 Tax=Lacisediminihabitans profunda TaxID=2594790 RepID=A0A5C8URA5_9MICO|nr:SGNH/GDSL hydrolase family protein [Lacisediminihabitans profunda]TXN30480.1 SGNH/GDSL hydrolase family protein [Lacisediminihabitans profunda]
MTTERDKTERDKTAQPKAAAAGTATVRTLRPNILSRLVAVTLSPVLIVQARRARRIIPRLPDAAEPWSGTLAGPHPVRLLVLGDSTAAGVGADTQNDALPGNLAREVARVTGRGTRWHAVGENGATARDLLQRFVGTATEQSYDLVFLSIGANDALALRSRLAFARDVRELVARLRAASPDALILVSLMPRFDRFSSLVNPLRWNLALHAASLDDGARAAVGGLDRVFAIPKPPPYTPTFWASDLFHPSASGYREWIEFAIGVVPSELLNGLVR